MFRAWLDVLIGFDLNVVMHVDHAYNLVKHFWYKMYQLNEMIYSNLINMRVSSMNLKWRSIQDMKEEIRTSIIAKIQDGLQQHHNCYQPHKVSACIGCGGEGCTITHSALNHSFLIFFSPWSRVVRNLQLPFKPLYSGPHAS